MRPSPLQVFRKLEQELLDGEIHAAYTFCGEESYLVQEACRALTERLVPPEAREWDLDHLSAAEIDPQDLVSAAMTLPMLGTRRVLLVADMEKTRPEGLAVWQRYLRNPSSSTVVVFSLPGHSLGEEREEGESPSTPAGEGLSAKGKRGIRLADLLRKFTAVYEFDALNDQEAVGWVVERMTREQKRISPHAAQLLVDQVGTDLHALENEIQKLALRALERDEVGMEEVEDVVVGQRGFTVYHLRDAIAEQDLARSLRILRRVLELGVPESVVLNSLVEHFMTAALASGLVKQGAPDQRIAEVIDPKYRRDWIARKYRRFLSLYDKPEGRLERALEALAKADLALKLSYQTRRRILELLVYCLVKDRPAEVLEVPAEID